MKKKVLICGASGFIGRNLFDFFSAQEDSEVYGTYLNRKFMDHPNLIQADLTKEEDALRVTKGMDVVIQAAAVTSGAKDIVSRPYIHVTNNVIMNARVLQAVFDNSVPHFVFPSCTIMYPSDTGYPVREIDVDYDNIYPKYFGGGWMKVYVEKLCEFYARLGRTKFTVVRHSNIYGPHDKYDLEKSHVFGATITKIMTAQNGGTIMVWGEGKEERDFLHVDDLNRFIMMAMQSQQEAFGLYNVGLGVSVAIRDLVQRVVKISGKQLSIQYDTTKPTIPTKLSVDIRKAKDIFGWEPSITLDEGIARTIIWYQNNHAVS